MLDTLEGTYTDYTVNLSFYEDMNVTTYIEARR